MKNTQSKLTRRKYFGFCMLFLTSILLSSCTDITDNSIDDEPLPILGSDSEESSVPLQNYDDFQNVISYFDNMSNPPTANSWNEVAEVFPDLVLDSTVEPTNPASKYAIGTEEYYSYTDDDPLLDENPNATTTTFVRHLELNAIIGVYPNITPTDLLAEQEALVSTNRNTTSVEFSTGNRTDVTPPDETEETTDSSSSEEAKNSTNEESLEAAPTQAIPYTPISPGNFTTILSSNTLIYITFYNADSGPSEQILTYHDSLNTIIANPSVFILLLPYQDKSAYSIDAGKITPQTSIVLHEDKAIAKYLGTYSDQDILRELLRLISTYSLQQ